MKPIRVTCTHIAYVIHVYIMYVCYMLYVVCTNVNHVITSVYNSKLNVFMLVLYNKGSKNCLRKTYIENFDYIYIYIYIY